MATPEQAALTKQQKQQKWTDYYNTNVAPVTPDAFEPTKDSQRAKYGHRYYRAGKNAAGAMGAVRRLDLLRQTWPGYGQPEEALKAHAQSSLADLNAGNYGVDLHPEADPVFSTLQTHLQERIGSGLTPEEWAAYQGRGEEQLQGNYLESRRTMGNDTAASGLDPRAATAAMGRLENERMQAGANLQRDLRLTDLSRKSEIEKLAAGVGDTEQKARQFDVTAEQARRGQVEDLNRGLAGLAEQRREYDLGFVEARTQAEKNRQLMMHLAKLAQPGGLERASAILGGINAGISSAAGGGGGGMMGGMMGGMGG